MNLTKEEVHELLTAVNNRCDELENEIEGIDDSLTCRNEHTYDNDIKKCTQSINKLKSVLAKLEDHIENEERWKAFLRSGDA